MNAANGALRVKATEFKRQKQNKTKKLLPRRMKKS